MAESPYIHERLFRMTHIENLRFILRDGLYAPNAKRYAEYLNIGDEVLIAQRKEFVVPVAPGGVLSDYVPFYFGGRSPMLLNIKTGYRGVRQREQSEIVFLCAHIDVIVNSCPDFCFTDGHAKDSLTAYYNNLENLDKVDWSVVSLSYWSNTEDDPDRMRRKQAEFLVKNYVPLSCVSGIIVFDNKASVKVKDIMKEVGIILPVYIDVKRIFYY